MRLASKNPPFLISVFVSGGLRGRICGDIVGIQGCVLNFDIFRIRLGFCRAIVFIVEISLCFSLRCGSVGIVISFCWDAYSMPHITLRKMASAL